MKQAFAKEEKNNEEIIQTGPFWSYGNKLSCLFSGKDTDGSNKTTSATSDISVAMITDSGEITDKSFNQTTYEASKAWSEKNGADFKYYKPSADTTDARVQAIETALLKDIT